MKVINIFILYSALICSLGRVSAEELSTGDYTRELLVRLAEDGSEHSYREIERTLTVLKSDQPLFAGNQGYLEGKRSIEKALNIIGDRGDESSYRFLDKLMRDNFKNSGALDSSMWTYILSNLLKYRESKDDELVGLIEEAMHANYEESNRLLQNYPSVGQEGIYYSFGKDDYVNEANEVVYQDSINRGVRYDHLIDSLRVIDSEQSYELMLSYFKSWVGREDTNLINYIEMHLKEKRYDSHVIGIYEALFKDAHHHPDIRNQIITAFFTNKPVLYIDHIDNPEKFYPQLDELDQERLVRILALTDYALSIDFLTEETIALLQSKRGQMLELLSAMGYDPEQVKKAVVEAPTIPELAIEAPAEVTVIEVASEESTNWLLWLIGALVVLGGLAIVVRRKS